MPSCSWAVVPTNCAIQSRVFQQFLRQSCRPVPWFRLGLLGPLSAKPFGQKPPLKPKEIWAIRIRLQMSGEKRNLALFDLALDSKLRACDLLTIRLKDVVQEDCVRKRARILQQKTRRPVQFEITSQTRSTILDWVEATQLGPEDYLFPSRRSPQFSTRQYARIVNRWVESAGLDASAYGTHSLRRTKPSVIYRRTKNLRAIQLLLGHTKLENRYGFRGDELETLATEFLSSEGIICSNSE